MLEKLYRLKWSPLDGLGALIISPTRELALQIFDELRKMGKKHEFSAGLLIGGKKVKEEQERVHGEHTHPPNPPKQEGYLPQLSNATHSLESHAGCWHPVTMR